jgi:Heavy metal associated domain 2
MNINAIEKEAAAARNDGCFAFELTVVHHVPGRLRLRSAALKGNSDLCEIVQRRLADCPGLTALTLNPHTGTLLVLYDPAVTAAGDMAQTLVARGFTLALSPAEARPIDDWADRLAGALGRLLIESLAERLTAAMIGALA